MVIRGLRLLMIRLNDYCNKHSYKSQCHLFNNEKSCMCEFKGEDYD